MNRGRISFATLGLLIALANRSLCATNPPPASDADRLIAASIQSEISGHIPQSWAKLHEAVRKFPENRLAHSLLGEITLDGKWVSIEEAQRLSAADPDQAAYRARRDAAGDDPQSQLALARWCRKNKLNDEARIHWASVLSADPNNEDALRALDVRWYKGRILSTSEIAARKEADNSRRHANWAASITRWRYAIDGKNSKLSRDDALAEIRAVDSLDAISAVEAWTLKAAASRSRDEQNAHDVSLAFVAALKNIHEQPATESLLRHAVRSSFADVRGQAIDGLKSRPLHNFVPLLLDGLKMPVESSYSIYKTDDGSVHYQHSFYQVGATADRSMEYMNGAWQTIVLGLKSDLDNPRQNERRDAITRFRASQFEGKFKVQAARTESELDNENRQSSLSNMQIIYVLTATTGEENGSDPQKWWGWWQNYNEYYVPEKRPVYEQNYVKNEKRYYHDQSQMSCFAKGTPVWTKTGLRPIDELEIGDLVLSQDVNSGNLKFEPVIGRTVRPPSQILKISAGDDTIRTTRGHPFWVAGIGWRMAKELGDGAMLHGLKGAAEVRKVEPAGEGEAYNLVVADFNTYFVGESGVLVHDNTRRAPTQAIVPGYIAKK